MLGNYTAKIVCIWQEILLIPLKTSPNKVAIYAEVLLQFHRLLSSAAHLTHKPSSHPSMSVELTPSGC